MSTLTLDELATHIPSGCLLAVPPDYSGVAMAATRALIQHKPQGLRVLCVPVGSIQVDQLIGAGMVDSVEAAAVTLGEFGLAPRFTAAVQNGSLTVKDTTCPAVHAMLQATEKGVPFMPLRGLLGTDILAHRDDWKVLNNPFAERPDPLVLLPAVQPDVALFHAPMADSEGNVWIGRRRELVTMAHAAKTTLVTVERIVEGCFFDDEQLAAGVLPGLYVSHIALAPRGAWPLGLGDAYAPDAEHLAAYARLARSDDGFADYLARYVLTPVEA
ncbi:MAG: CoA transferase [Gammaproteobacteria bacterium]